MHTVKTNGQGKIIKLLGQTLIMSSLIHVLLHFQASSSPSCYSPALSRRRLGDDPHVCGLSSVAA